jgi:hypothetical protein
MDAAVGGKEGETAQSSAKIEAVSRSFDESYAQPFSDHCERTAVFK